MSLVWEHAPCRENALIVLLALADWSNDDGTCWPSIQKLADKSRVDRRSAQRIVRRLKEDGFITIEEGGGRAKQHRYHIETAALCRPLENGDFQNSGIAYTERAALETERATFPTQTATPVSPDPLEDPLVDPPIEPLGATALFFNSLKTNPAYSHVDIDREVFKMQAWLSLPGNKGRKLTPRFVLNWLNKIERPLAVGSNGTKGKPVKVESAEEREKRESCTRCFSTGTENVPGKGARMCNHERQNETTGIVRSGGDEIKSSPADRGARVS